jgi:hypothetical protein
MWTQADAEKAQLLNLIEKVQAKLDKRYSTNSGSVISTDLRSATWSQVLAQVNETSRRWSESRKTTNMSVFLEKIGRNSDTFQTWLQVLPQGDYGSRQVQEHPNHGG